MNKGLFAIVTMDGQMIVVKRQDVIVILMIQTRTIIYLLVVHVVDTGFVLLLVGAMTGEIHVTVNVSANKVGMVHSVMNHYVVVMLEDVKMEVFVFMMILIMDMGMDMDMEDQ